MSTQARFRSLKSVRRSRVEISIDSIWCINAGLFIASWLKCRWHKFESNRLASQGFNYFRITPLSPVKFHLHIYSSLQLWSFYFLALLKYLSLNVVAISSLSTQSALSFPPQNGPSTANLELVCSDGFWLIRIDLQKDLGTHLFLSENGGRHGVQIQTKLVDMIPRVVFLLPKKKVLKI